MNFTTENISHGNTNQEVENKNSALIITHSTFIMPKKHFWSLHKILSSLSILL